MKTSKLLIWAGSDFLGGFCMFWGASWVISHGNEMSGTIKNFWAPVAFLLFLVFSATIEGALILGSASGPEGKHPASYRVKFSRKKVRPENPALCALCFLDKRKIYYPIKIIFTRLHKI